MWSNRVLVLIFHLMIERSDWSSTNLALGSWLNFGSSVLLFVGQSWRSGWRRSMGKWSRWWLQIRWYGDRQSRVLGRYHKPWLGSNWACRSKGSFTWYLEGGLTRVLGGFSGGCHWNQVEYKWNGLVRKVFQKSKRISKTKKKRWKLTEWPDPESIWVHRVATHKLAVVVKLARGLMVLFGKGSMHLVPLGESLSTSWKLGVGFGRSEGDRKSVV